MGKRVEYTPKSRITSALRTVWMRSRERAAAIKQTNGHCVTCNAKQTSAKGRVVKLQVHHAYHRPNWDRIIKVVMEELLQTPDQLWPMCKGCHVELHEKVDSGEMTQGEFVQMKVGQRTEK